MNPTGYFTPDDPFGGGGITYQLDHHLRALQHATWIDDPRLYANLVAQVAAILRPKLDEKQYARLSNLKVEYTPTPNLGRREERLEYERAMFQAARNNLAELLLIASEHGIYAKKDESPTVADASEMAIKGSS